MLFEDEKFIDNPNLPQNKITFCAVSSLYPELLSALQKYKIRCFGITPNPNLQYPVCSHADMQLHHLGGKELIIADNLAQSELLQKEGFHFYATEALEPEYPGDIKLNAARIGNLSIANQNCISPSIIKNCADNQISSIHTQQGYTKCSICILNEKAIITSDPSIAKAVNATDLDVLVIVQGFIEIEQYNTGFLGGCCGKIAPNVMAFTGDLSLHPNYHEIKLFFQKYHIEIVCLSDHKLIDIGGIIPLKEKRK